MDGVTSGAAGRDGAVDEISVLRQALRQSEAREAAAETKAAAMADEVVQLAAARRAAERQAAVARQVVEAVKEQMLTPLQSDKDRLTEENRVLAATILELRGLLRDSEQTQAVLQRRLDRASRPSHKVSEKSLRCAELELMLEAEREEAAGLRASNAALRRQLRALTDKRNSREDVQEEAAAAETALEKIHLLSGANETLQRSMDALTTEKEAASATIQRLEVVVADQSAQIQRLSNELNEACAVAGGSEARPEVEVDRLQHDAVLRNTLMCIFNQRQRDLEEQLAARGAECRAMALRVQALEARLTAIGQRHSQWAAAGRARCADVKDALAGAERRMVALESVLFRDDSLDA